MRPNDFDDDRSSVRSDSLSAHDLLNWGTCRTEMSIAMVAGIFLFLGLGMLLYIELAGRDGLEMTLVIMPPMILMLYLGIVMIIVSLFVGGAPTESGASGWSLGTRVSFLAFLLSVEGRIYLEQTRGLNETLQDLLLYLFAAELALVMIFWSLYQRAVAKWVGRRVTAGATIPFMLLSIACVGLYTYQYLDSMGIRGRGGFGDDSLMTITSALLVLLALFQAILGGSIRSGITKYVVQNVPSR